MNFPRTLIGNLPLSGESRLKTICEDAGTAPPFMTEFAICWYWSQTIKRSFPCLPVSATACIRCSRNRTPPVNKIGQSF